jgi:hypothetical protein
MGSFLALEEINDNCRKTVHMEMIERRFPVQVGLILHQSYIPEKVTQI